MLTLEYVMFKSKKNLDGLHPVVRRATEVLIESSHYQGVPIKITQGLRTIAYQNTLYAQGRTQSQLNSVGLAHVKAQPNMPVVTDAVGGKSYHNYGLAIDFVLLLPDGKSVSWDMSRDGDGDNIADWKEVVDIAKKLGFGWGGDWKSKKDYPHFDMTFGLTTSQLRLGSLPSVAKVKSAHEVIDKYLSTTSGKEEQPMTATEKKLFDDMAKLVKSQQEEIVSLKASVEKLELTTKMSVIPEWALSACVNAKAAGFLDTTANGSYDFYRMVTILDRLGLFTKK